MEASELRIGNWFHVAYVDRSMEKDRQVISTDFKSIENGYFIHEPIPLTEEWLLKFGFFVSERITGEYFFGCSLFQNRDSDEFVIPDEDGYHYIRDISSSAFDGSTEYRTTTIKYVHQLQNLYFALTGTELTIR